MTNIITWRMRRAKAFAQEHLKECAEELVQWRETALLSDGRVRELAGMLEPLDAANSLSLAEGLIVHAALRAVAEAG